MQGPEDITGRLNAWAAGDPGALDQLVPQVLEELRFLARRAMGRSPGLAPTLQPTALVNEAYLRLVGMRPGGFENRTRFFALAAQVIRGVLLDHARARFTEKRGGALPSVPLDEALCSSAPLDLDTVLSVGEALERLEATHPRAGKVAELRLFAGLTLGEIAHVLGHSASTVERDWTLARRRLARELKTRR